MNARTKGFMFGVAVGLLIHYGYTRSTAMGTR